MFSIEVKMKTEKYRKEGEVKIVNKLRYPDDIDIVYCMP